MNKSIQITLIVCGTIVLLALLGMFVYFQTNPANTITETGTATLKVLPDEISVYFSVDTQASNAADAKDTNTEIYDKVSANLVKAGFAESEILTQGYSITPVSDWSTGKERILGYRAIHSLKILLTVNETDKIGPIIDATANEGALINSINFELSQAKNNEYKAQALEQATQDAKIKADSIANGLGKSVGRVVSVADIGYNYYPRVLYESASGVNDVAAAKVATTSIQPGEQDVTASVSVVFALK